MKNISIWKDNIKIKNFKKLDSDKEVDVLIIGGGITGISSLYHLNNSKYKVMLVDQNKIGMGVTGNSTGKLSYLQNDLIDKIRNNFDDDIAYKYIDSQRDSIDIIKDIVNKEKIECDLKKVDSYLYTNKEDEIDKIKDLEIFLKNRDIDVYKDSNNLVKNKYMIRVKNTYIFNPIKFIYGLIKDNNNIYEDTSIKKISKDNEYYICYTDKYIIKCKYVVLASHYPYFLIPYLFPIKGSLERSYLSASKYKDNKDISLISYSYPFISIRSYKDYLIYLSNSHSLDKDMDIYNNFKELKKKIKDLGLKEDYLWSNIDIMTNDGLPYIGKIKDNMYIGTGYNTWGLTNGFLAGKIISDMILGKDNKYINLFDPKRSNFSKNIGIVNDIGKSISSYIKGYFVKNKNIIYDNDKMIYKDNNKEYIVCRKCPHLGCRLLFNSIEKTWDCHCHGSRFDIEGRCISGPSNRDITYKENNKDN